MANQHQGSLVMAEPLSFVHFNHLSQLKNKNKCINITSLFNVGAVKGGGDFQSVPTEERPCQQLEALLLTCAWVCCCVKCSWAVGEETPDPPATGPSCINLSTEGNGA